MTIVFRLSGIFHTITLVAFLFWLAPRVVVSYEDNVVESFIPIRAIYGEGYYWVNFGFPNSLPYKGSTYRIMVSSRGPLIVETYLGRTFLTRRCVR